MTPEQEAIFVGWRPSVIGIILGTGYDDFLSKSGVRGLAKPSEQRLDILAVISGEPGRGQFRQFIADAKRAFPEVGVWAEMNPFIGEVLERYGFRKASMTEEDGSITEGWLWDKAAQGVSLGADGMG